MEETKKILEKCLAELEAMTDEEVQAISKKKNIIIPPPLGLLESRLESKEQSKVSASDVFKKTLEKLGFANHKPSDMSNSDYWMCTIEAMEQFANQSNEEPISEIDKTDFEELDFKALEYLSNSQSRPKSEQDLISWLSDFAEMMISELQSKSNEDSKTGWVSIKQHKKDIIMCYMEASPMMLDIDKAQEQGIEYYKKHFTRTT